MSGREVIIRGREEVSTGKNEISLGASWFRQKGLSPYPQAAPLGESDTTSGAARVAEFERI
jgi:hypothetical protein